MSLSKVYNVYVVANTSAVWVVIGSEDGNILLLAEGNLQDIGNQMGLDPVVLSKAETCAGCVEVAERHVFDAVDFIKPPKHLLEHELGFSIGVDGFLGKGLIDGNSLRSAKGGAGGGEDDFFHTALDHGFQEMQSQVTLFLKYFTGLVMDSPTRAFAAECMTASALDWDSAARPRPGVASHLG
jgi:hypothetical protein